MDRAISRRLVRPGGAVYAAAIVRLGWAGVKRGWAIIEPSGRGTWTWGVVDVHTRDLEPVEEVVDGIRKTLKLIPPERVWVLPDCGLKTRTVEEAEAKLGVMMDSTRAIKRELEID